MVDWTSACILIQLILLIFILVLLWHFCAYLEMKPLGNQSLLDGANKQFFQYMALTILTIHFISFSYEVSGHEMNEVLAKFLAWYFLGIQQIFFYQLLICALIRLSIVLNIEIKIADELLHQIIRICLVTFSGIFILVLFSQGHQRPFAFTLQGKAHLKPNSSVGPTIIGLSLTVQGISRLIVYLKVGRFNHGQSNELITTKTFLTLLVFLFTNQFIIIAFELANLTVSMTVVHGGFLAMLLQIIYHSKSLKKYLQKKYSRFNVPNQISPIV